jgi:hypothetical protein
VDIAIEFLSFKREVQIKQVLKNIPKQIKTSVYFRDCNNVIPGNLGQDCFKTLMVFQGKITSQLGTVILFGMFKGGKLNKIDKMITKVTNNDARVNASKINICRDLVN